MVSARIEKGFATFTATLKARGQKGHKSERHASQPMLPKSTLRRSKKPCQFLYLSLNDAPRQGQGKSEKAKAKAGYFRCQTSFHRQNLQNGK